jgi:hypothetical protein
VALTVERLRRYLDHCKPTDPVVVSATLADGSVLGVSDLNVGTGQGGPDGESVEVVIDWEPGAEVVTPSIGAARPHCQTLPMTSRRIALFLVGLVAGYILSGFVLGPGVLAVLLGVVVGLVLAGVLGR